jgi:hypothetical protein
VILLYHSRADISRNVGQHTVELFTKTKLWSQPRCPSNNEWIFKIWYIYTMEYYSAIKNEIGFLQENGWN